MSQENILIPLAPDSRDLKALHHAISLAERIDSRIIVFCLEPEKGVARAENPVMEACRDVISRVPENGLNISLLVTSAQGEEAATEFIQLLAQEGIDLIIISDTERYMAEMIKKIMPAISCQVVQVREKNSIKPLTG